ncbi:MAG: pyrroline-5-carboxylate reductase [Clostridia bacterium]|nr:pyrroline-5-carboxylate reductase [Clostridia bacterium]
MKIGFIGCGNMGSALARATLKSGVCELFVSDASAEKAGAFASEYGASVSTNEKIARECDFIFLAVKPNVFPAVIEPLRDSFKANCGSVIVTMAAGLSLARLGELLADNAHPVIRIMPNTPAAIGYGMILWCKNDYVSSERVGDFETLLSGAGKLDMIAESLIDAASAVSGCGPAFVYMFIEALADGAVECGLPRDKAMAYAAETLIGAAEMVKQSGKHPGLLKDEVCSPGGSTIEGVRALEEGAFRATASRAVKEAYEKTKKLGK